MDAGRSLEESSTLTAQYRDALGEYRGWSYRAEVVDALSAMGIPLEIEDLAAAGSPVADDPLGPLIDVLGKAAESDYEFGSYLTTAASDGSFIEQRFEPESSTVSTPA